MDVPLSSVSVVLPFERDIMSRVNSTTVDFGPSRTIGDMFLQRVAENGDHTAVVLDGVTLTYRELHARAARLASVIVTSVKGGITRDTIICQCVTRSIEMVIGIIGIALSGASYCPLNPTDPVERLHLLLTDTASPIVLTQRAIATSTLNTWRGGECVIVDELDLGSGSSGSVTSVTTPITGARHARSSDIAYCIYTSGSTVYPRVRWSVMVLS